MDHSARRARVRERLSSLGVDALYVSSLANVRYLSGFTGSNGYLLVGAQGGVFVTDGRYVAQAEHEVSGLEHASYRTDLSAAVAGAARRLDAAVIGFEAEALTVQAHEDLVAAGVRTEPTRGVVEALREIKDADEIRAIQAAQDAVDHAHGAVLAKLNEGMTEREVAFELEASMRDAGSERVAFDTIVAFGAGAAEPHHAPTDRRLARGDLVEWDLGAVVDGYRSDMTRTVAFGEPSARAREVYEVVRAAQAVGVSAALAGATAGSVDAAARDPIGAAGFGDAFTHGLGHGVGLEIHEAPSLRIGNERRLAAGTVVTVEPGIYLDGVVGCPDRGHGRGDGRGPAGDGVVTEGADRRVALGATRGRFATDERGHRMSISTNDLKRGMTLDLDGTLYQVIEFQHVKPGKGGAFVRTKLRNVRTGGVVERTFNAGVSVGVATVERGEMQYLYRDGDEFVFMDTGSYEQTRIPAEVVDEAANFLTEGATATVALHDGQPLSLELPASVVLTVTSTDPGVKGDRVAGALKPATLETGYVVQVPLFVEEGDRLKVDTRSGDYITREK